ncbi:cytosine deaminase [Pseudooceanicola sp. CBS1P-1]|uniref:Cytosine deaminase n=1 Tax=Pseudooceanicola albus TaxID=2692189 RepID=A0A6L7G795_9RHOB|nr:MULTISPECIES: cytosine deaminase [Pseudooceanicola]MBT9382992.1 cytosine deaminase [Pseudooceanicola endophyticus]MXN19180.1 cytosine deaminase [Pseudooceanicola albus]
MALPKLPGGPVRLTNLSVPGYLVGASTPFAPASVAIRDGKFTADTTGLPQIDMRGAIAFPRFVEAHTHLDKGHITPRMPNPTGTFEGALGAVGADAAARWTTEDVRARMTFALKSAYAHGTGAIRTHLDSQPPKDGIAWPLFAEVRAEWADRIALQASCLVTCLYLTDPAFQGTADWVAKTGGILGAVTYPNPDLQAQLDIFFDTADARGLHTDIHVDETMDPTVNTLRDIAKTVLARGYDRKLQVGHVCSLSTMPEKEALETLDLVAEAGIDVVSLPMCNLYLQDRHAGRTPRNRGITLVHEMVERGINVSFASDNTRDPFYAYGDLDMIEVMREAMRIGHLDHSDYPWFRSFLANPAAACGFDTPDFAPGKRADMVICNARNWTELFSRPQHDRLVMVGGACIDTTLPDYEDLDDIMRIA